MNTTNTTPSGADALDVAMSKACIHSWDQSQFTSGDCDAVHPMFSRAFEAGYRAALSAAEAQASGQAAPAVPLLAADHKGMRVDYTGMLDQCQRALRHTEPGLAEMLRQLQGHLTVLGQCWYAGDTAAVDEFLQLYCIEDDARAALAAQAHEAAPQSAQPLTDEHKAILEECRNQAMRWTLDARPPESGAFGGIAQDLDYLCGQLGIKND